MLNPVRGVVLPTVLKLMVSSPAFKVKSVAPLMVELGPKLISPPPPVTKSGDPDRVTKLTLPKSMLLAPPALVPLVVILLVMLTVSAATVKLSSDTVLPTLP